MAAASEVKQGFYLGIGIFLALILLGFLQAMTLRAVSKRG